MRANKTSATTPTRRKTVAFMQGLKNLLTLLYSVSLLCKTGLASERSIMDGATAEMSTIKADSDIAES